MYKLSEMFGQRGGLDAFGRGAVKKLEFGQTLDKHLLKLAPLVFTFCGFYLGFNDIT